MTEHPAFQVIWCWFFHSKRRTGKRIIRRISITYDTICEKCGVEGYETYWIK